MKVPKHPTLIGRMREARVGKLAAVYDHHADAPEEGIRRSMIQKLDRALEIAGEGPHIADAIAMVRQFADTVLAELR